jgi:hypothetical protein
MTNRNDETAFIAKLKAILDGSVDALDAPTRARLRAVRRQALAQARAPRGFAPRWFVPLGAAAVLAVVAVLDLWWLPPATPPPLAASAEDAELLFAADNLELYQNLDFYRWLAAKERSG